MTKQKKKPPTEKHKVYYSITLLLLPFFAEPRKSMKQMQSSA